MPGIQPIAIISLAVSTLVIYWAGWHDLRIVAPVLLGGFVVHAAVTASQKRFDWRSYRHGAWMAVYLGVIWLWSFLGSYGGDKTLTQPWDSISLAAIALVIFEWSVQRRGQPGPPGQHLRRAGTLRRRGRPGRRNVHGSPGLTRGNPVSSR